VNLNGVIVLLVVDSSELYSRVEVWACHFLSYMLFIFAEPDLSKTGGEDDRIFVGDLCRKIVSKHFRTPQTQGGGRRRKVAKSKKAYTKTSRVYVGKDGIKRTLYTNKDGKAFVKKKSPKTGKFAYRPVKL